MRKRGSYRPRSRVVLVASAPLRPRLRGAPRGMAQGGRSQPPTARGESADDYLRRLLRDLPAPPPPRLPYVARYMGTSLAMIDRTYGHLVQGSEEVARARLDAFADRLRHECGTDAAEQVGR